MQPITRAQDQSFVTNVQTLVTSPVRVIDLKVLVGLIIQNEAKKLLFTILPRIQPHVFTKRLSKRLSTSVVNFAKSATINVLSIDKVK
ncbi:MAG: hypothetical protein WC511_03150 [Candidatus Pacearchaeota archaeon]